VARPINPYPTLDGPNITRAQWNVRVRPELKAQVAAIPIERGVPLCHVTDEAFEHYLEEVREGEALAV
jgi:hypothetical protein